MQVNNLVNPWLKMRSNSAMLYARNDRDEIIINWAVSKASKTGWRKFSGKQSAWCPRTWGTWKIHWTLSSPVIPSSVKSDFCTRNDLDVFGSRMILSSPSLVNRWSSTSFVFPESPMRRKGVLNVRNRKVKSPCNLSLKSSSGNKSSLCPGVRIRSLSHARGNAHLRSGLNPHLSNFCPDNFLCAPSFSVYISYNELIWRELCRDAFLKALRPFRRLHLLQQLYHNNIRTDAYNINIRTHT